MDIYVYVDIDVYVYVDVDVCVCVRGYVRGCGRICVSGCRHKFVRGCGLGRTCVRGCGRICVRGCGRICGCGGAVTCCGARALGGVGRGPDGAAPLAPAGVQHARAAPPARAARRAHRLPHLLLLLQHHLDEHTLIKLNYLWGHKHHDET